MKLTRTAVSLKLAMAGLLSWLVAGDWLAAAHAAKPSQADAMAACRAKYGKKVIKAIINKDGTLTCQWQVARPMTRSEAYEACRKKTGAFTAFVHKTKNGWRCRYIPRY
jgi:hypothetical protein